ncbi:MAG TPA: hypothetical protein DDX98_05665 [Bacteroidales bacterium]|jgi:RNA polymerase sigma factor (sigma-70 family)|nr:hypothetical protein [Bacteroidales bacterium]
MVSFKKEKNFNKHKKLIEECKQENRRAQLKLYKIYYKAMYTVSLNMVKDRHQAEDLMQEAFISAFSHIKEFKGEVSFGAWLKKIVMNKCIDYLKARKINFESIENYSSVPAYTTNDETVAAEKTADEIKNEIHNLPDGYRTILSLYLLEGYDHEEISEILGISSSTSRSQYARAKALLVKRLNNK